VVGYQWTFIIFASLSLAALPLLGVVFGTGGQADRRTGGRVDRLTGGS
jgi:hypothetical protein